MRTLGRYRFLFRAMIAIFSLSVIMALIGLVAVFFGEGSTLLAAGVLLAAMSGLNGYKMVLSTMKIIDEDGSWAELSGQS